MILLVCLVDIVNYSDQNRTHQNWAVLQASLFNCLKFACLAARIPWDDLRVKDTGDGMQIIAPQSVEGGLFAGPFIDALRVELNRHNQAHERMEQLRLRIAFDLGEINEEEGRLVGPALVHVSRLIDADPLRKALERTNGVLGLIVSQFFFRDIVKQSAEYRHQEYREIYFQVKNDSGKAWVRVPGKALPSTPVLMWGKVIDAVRRSIRRLGR